jgi:hypothetical protein
MARSGSANCSGRSNIRWIEVGSKGVQPRMKPNSRRHPLIPKSNASLRSGDYWPVELVDGTFACGVVLQLPPEGRPGSRIHFFGGLIDWHGTKLPDPSELLSRSILRQGVMRFQSISEGQIGVLGNLDPLPDSWTPTSSINGNVIQRGYDVVRSYRTSDLNRLPTFSWWGIDYLWCAANAHFIGPPLIDLEGYLSAGGRSPKRTP